MPVTDVIMANGQWSVSLMPNLPKEILDALTGGEFGHVAILTGRQDPRIAGDSLLKAARYVGVMNGAMLQSKKTGGATISGEGMALWLGSAAGVGPVIEAPGLSFTAATVGSVVTALVAAATSTHLGTIHSIGGGTYTGAFIWKVVKDALTSLCTQLTNGSGPTQTVEWRVNSDATVDFGHVSDLYVTGATPPTTAIVAKDDGVDMTLRALPGQVQITEDVKDYTNEAIVLAQGSGLATAVGRATAADLGASNPYVDLFGNPVTMTRMVSASGVSSVNATVSAQAALAPYVTPRDQLQLSSTEYDIQGLLAVGDYTYVYDPDSDLVDAGNEIVFRGQRINPVLLRIIELTWPVVAGMTVAFRAPNGAWYDLTDYVAWESGTTTVVVGGYNRQLVSTSEPVGSRPIPDTTIPGVPIFGTPATSVYQSTSDGRTRAQITMSWTTPTNTDATTITDGDHYDLIWQANAAATEPLSIAALEALPYTIAQLEALSGTVDQLIPLPTLEWHRMTVTWGTNQVTVTELTPGVSYNFQIQAVDTANPPNLSGFSATTIVTAAADTIPPNTPDAPTVAGDLISVQVTHDLGSATGGTFNLASDLHHLEIHGSYDPLFQPAPGTLLGRITANIGNLTAQTAVVGTFSIGPGQPPAQNMYIKVIAVDETGNRSLPSAAAGVTAVLLSDEYITSLTVSKLLAGTINADFIVGARIKTADTGARVELNTAGLQAYDSDGNLTVSIAAATGSVSITGSYSTSFGSNAVSISPSADLTNWGGSSSAPAIFMGQAGSESVIASAVDWNGLPGLWIQDSPATYTGAFSLSSSWTSGVFIGPTTSTSNSFVSLGGSDKSTGALHGGLVQVGADGTCFIGEANQGTPIAYLGFDDNSFLYPVGHFHNFSSAGANDALWFAAFDYTAGHSSITMNYGPTMASEMSPIPSIWDGFATNTYPSVTADSTTGFNVSFPNAHAVRIMVMAFRT